MVAAIIPAGASRQNQDSLGAENIYRSKVRTVFRYGEGALFPSPIPLPWTDLTPPAAFAKLKVAARLAESVRLVSVPKWRNWQTRMVQVHVLARVWGFESLLRHQVLYNQ